MLLKIMTQLVYWSRLGNIPGVSTWVNSHRWARILAWSVFPSIFWTVIIAGLRVSVTGDKKVTPWVKDQQYGLNGVIYAQEVAPSLKFATAQVIPNPKGSNVTAAQSQVTTNPQNADFGGTYPTYQNYNQQPGLQAGG